MLSWLFWPAGHSVPVLCPVHTLGRAVLLLSWFLWASGDWVILTVWRAFQFLCVCIFSFLCIVFSRKRKHIFSFATQYSCLPYYILEIWPLLIFPLLNEADHCSINCYFFVTFCVRKLTVGRFSARTLPTPTPVMISRLSTSLSFPWLCALYRWQSESSPGCPPEGRIQIRASECEIEGQSEESEELSGLLILCQCFCFWPTSAFGPILYFPQKEFFQVIESPASFTAEWNKKGNH